MSGWRHFGIEIKGNPEIKESPEILARLLHNDYGCDESKLKDGFFCACCYGYGSPENSPDPELFKWLEESDRRGYYIMMNDTTDTGEGVIRFERGGELTDITDLVDLGIETGDPEVEQEQLVYDGKNSRLPEFQMGAPGWPEVYDLLDFERFPVVGRY